MSEGKCFSSLVLAFGCRQIKITLADEERALFVTPTGVSVPWNTFVTHECPRDVSIGSK